MSTDESSATATVEIETRLVADEAAERPPDPERLVMKTRTGAHLYELRGVLGEGGMGRVYLAWDPNLEREVALKITLLRSEDSPELVERFLREARLTARIPHPGVVQVFDAGTLDDGRALYAMQRVQGSSLRARLKEPPLSTSLRRRIEVLLRVCEVVAFAHAQGVVHRV